MSVDAFPLDISAIDSNARINRGGNPAWQRGMASPNPAGRPPAAREAEYNEARRRAVSPDDLARLTARLFARVAEAFEDKRAWVKAIPAYERLSDELGGKPAVHIYSEGYGDLQSWMMGIKAQMEQGVISALPALPLTHATRAETPFESDRDNAPAAVVIEGETVRINGEIL